jgi:hypothetical protein
MEDYAKPAEAVAEAVKVNTETNVGTSPEYKTLDLLIAQLQAIRAAKGNLIPKVQVFTDSDNGGSYSFEPITGFFYGVDENKCATEIILCDKDTLDGLSQNSDCTEEEIKPKGEH